MIKGTTYIDTVKIQIDKNTSLEQQDMITDLLEVVYDQESMFIKKKEIRLKCGRIWIEHLIMFKGKKIAGITSGMYVAGSRRLRNRRTVYYVAVKFAGLKRYVKKIDNASFECLLNICYNLNCCKHVWKFMELDLAHDIRCGLENLVAMVTRRVPNINYFAYDDPDGYYLNTHYIEKIEKKKVHTAVSRAYTYRKNIKANLDYELTRFELKLQPRFFNTNGVTCNAIEKVLTKYTIMYFVNLDIRDSVLSKYSNLSKLQKKTFQKEKLDQYTIELDIGYIKEFICMLSHIDDYMTFELLQPSRDRDDYIDKLLN